MYLQHTAKAGVLWTGIFELLWDFSCALILPFLPSQCQFPPIPLPFLYQNSIGFFTQAGEESKERGRRGNGAWLFYFYFLSARNNKIIIKWKGYLLYPQRLSSWKSEWLWKNRVGEGLWKLLHFSNQTKIKNKTGNKNKRYPTAISKQFQSMQVPIQPNTAELSLSSNFAFFFFSVLYFLCCVQLFCLKLL